MDFLLAARLRHEISWAARPRPGMPTLVFLHEGLGCVAAWRDFPALLAAETGCGAFVYSRAGYGGSDPVALPRPLDYMEREAALLPEILDVAGVRDAILVGHSDGASIAILHGASDTASPRVRRLILEAPHVFVEDIGVKSIEEARDAWKNTDLKIKLTKLHGANVDVAFQGWNRAWLDPAFRAWNIEAALPRLRAPVLVIQGAEDPYGTLRQVEAIEAGSAAPVTRCLLTPCGHSPHKDRPAETLAAMAAFVRASP